VARARRLRREATPAERVLWRCLRARRGIGPKARRQVPFGPYILDFAFLTAGLVVEIDGDTHATPAVIRSDAVRDAFLARNGLRLLRFSNREVMGNADGVMASIVAALG
jgi:very-short-patch-repair endonuclease